MTGEIKKLSKYCEDDVEKRNLIDDVLIQFQDVQICCELSMDESDVSNEFELSGLEPSDDIEFDTLRYNKMEKPHFSSKHIEFTKYCPKCRREYPQSEQVCLDCNVRLKDISDKIEVRDIKSDCQFVFSGKNDFKSFEDLLCEDNLSKIKRFNFSCHDYEDVINDIKSQAFKNFDSLIKANEVDFDSLDILDKILLFAKSFVSVDYKSSGGELGYYENGGIFIDDRQTDSLQITTLIHELSHFLIHEILVGILCKILDACKNSFVDSLVTFILSELSFTQLVDEYSAHNVEGRFTMFGYQDYSSFVQIERSLEGKMAREEIEVSKSIGNTFSLSIKGILESFIDDSLRQDIKDQFLKDVLDRPNYAALRMENCQILNDEGFISAIWLILNDGSALASANIDRLKSLIQ